MLRYAAPMALTQETTPFRSTNVRPGPVALVREAARESWSRRRLIRYLVQADLKKKGADTLLGNLWWVLDPILQMLVYVVLVTIIFQRDTPAYPLFIFAAILPWKWFTSSINDAIVSVTAQERLIKQIHFPKIVLPFAATVAGLVNFGFGLIGLAGLLILLFPDRISVTLVLLPIIAAVQFVFTLALTFLVAATNVFYRDLGNVSRHVLRLWFYLSPAIYSISQVDHIVQENPILGHLFNLNPFTILFEAYRAVIYSGELPRWSTLGALFLASLVLLLVATWLFKRVEPAFAKIL
jgi:ABC-type polysaccharide/polyol phosphate export permease